MEQLPDLLKKMQDVAIWTARWLHRVLSFFVGRRGMLLYRLYLNLRLFLQLTKRRIKVREP